MCQIGAKTGVEMRAAKEAAEAAGAQIVLGKRILGVLSEDLKPFASSLHWFSTR